MGTPDRDFFFFFGQELCTYCKFYVKLQLCSSHQAGLAVKVRDVN